MKKPIQHNREVQIGRRLRAFRESLRIPRTSLALSVNIGGERLASYEAGRVPVRYGVFKSIAEQYRLNPAWLARNEGDPLLKEPFDFSNLPPVPPKAVFSHVYDDLLHRLCHDKTRKAREQTRRLVELLEGFIEIVKDDPQPVDPVLLDRMERAFFQALKKNGQRWRFNKFPAAKSKRK